MPDSTSLHYTTAARRLVETLVVNEVDRIFCVPGESYLAVLDALADFRNEIQVIACRHEASAANMAAAHGKLTGRPGICFVTRGPGATQASVGVHTAHHDSAPMILFVGQIATGDKGREAFQEVDYSVMFAPLAKHVEEIDDPTRIVEITTRALATAMQGRPGPVVIALPEDMLVGDPGPRQAGRVTVAVSGLEPATLAEIAARLEAAERPLLVLGGASWTKTVLDQLATWAKRIDLPILLTFRRKDLVDNYHPCYAGDLGIGSNPKLLARVRLADLLLVLGSRLSDAPSQGYTLFDPEETTRKLIHIHPDPRELNRVWPASIAAAAGVVPAAVAISGLSIKRSWPAHRAAARADLEAFTKKVEVTGQVNLSEVYGHLSDVLPEDAIVCSGAGNFAIWLRRYYLFHGFGTELGPTSGAMGFGVPAAIAAKLAHPERTVVAVAGDGCFLMAGQEFATMMQYGINVVVLVIDNGSFGTIRMYQERNYPRRVSATDLRNPDFAAYARSFGAWGGTVEHTAEFPSVLVAALESGQPALVHIKTSVEDILPGQALSRLGAPTGN